MYKSKPRTLATEGEIKSRMRLLRSETPSEDLHDWSQRLAAKRGALVPFIDPGDAGTKARVVILVDGPGPSTAAGTRPGSGFVSVDNDNRTAENFWTHRKKAGLDHTMTLQWNVVPWYVGVEGQSPRRPNLRELKDGCAAFEEMLRMLPDLRAVVTCGKVAHEGWTRNLSHLDARLEVIQTVHPSPLSMNTPAKHAAFGAALARARVAAG